MREVLIVARKELSEMLRDKRVRSTALLGPALMIFIMLMLFGSVLGTLSKPSSQRITVAGTPGPIANALKASGAAVETVPTLAAGRAAIKNGKTPMVMAESSGPQGVRIDLLTDPQEPKAQIAAALVTEAVNRANASRRDAVLQAAGISKATAEPVSLHREEVRTGGKDGAGEFLVSLLPYLILIWAFYGGVPSAGDLVAGEKERQTLETLFLTPVTRWRILLGKWLALAGICLMASLASLAGLLLYAALKPKGSELILKGGLGLNALSGLEMILTLVPLAGFFSALLLALSALAKSTREAQSYIGLASFLVLMPAMGNQFVGLTDFSRSPLLAWVPILGSGVAIRESLLGRLTPGFWLATVAVNLVLMLLALVVARRAFLSERALSRAT